MVAMGWVVGVDFDNRYRSLWHGKGVGVLGG